NPLQLLMQIQGEGGTGKSKVIQMVMEYFKHQHCEIMLVKAAYMGIAASIINGKMTHTIGKIFLTDNKEISQEAKEWLRGFWKPVKYLILDKSSML
ncbi:hypothetical protein K439DRAFT_1248738, partial [Ramaria rubella]